jgi:hypothetical protein
MGKPDQEYFSLLKQILSRKYREAYPESDKEIADLKGREIVRFQELLESEVRGRVSEKWFYTHIKGDGAAGLPRIDILDMLSDYAGFGNWENFKASHPLPEAEVAAEDERWERTARFRTRQLRAWLLGTGIAGLAFFLGFLLNAGFLLKPVYTFCLEDAMLGIPVTDSLTTITILKDNGESPVSKRCGDDGCFRYKTRESMIRFIVRAPYHHPDTLTRQLDRGHTEERLLLQPDDYARIIRFFSNRQEGDWEQRRRQLDSMIALDAKILQVHAGKGMEILNKSEFIDKLTMPLSSLGRLEVLESEETDGQIRYLRFMQTGENSNVTKK